MNNLKPQIRFTMFLGVLSLLAVVIGHLALTDIYHAEVDVSLEWHVLQVCVFVILTFVISSLLTFRKILNNLKYD